MSVSWQHQSMGSHWWHFAGLKSSSKVICVLNYIWMNWLMVRCGYLETSRIGWYLEVGPNLLTNVTSVWLWSVFLLDSSVSGFTAEPAEWAAGTTEDILIIRAREASPQDIHTCQHSDCRAQVGGGERTTLEETDATATCVVGPAWPDTWSSLGHRPGEEWNDR